MRGYRRVCLRRRFPSKRNNCYSSLEYLLLVRDVLEGTEEMERLLGSCSGQLFRLPMTEVLDAEHEPKVSGVHVYKRVSMYNF